MLDENIWTHLSEDEKIAEMRTYLHEILQLEKGLHELSKTSQQGRLPEIKKELEANIFKIIELENAT
jgi:hypothetical protein